MQETSEKIHSGIVELFQGEVLGEAFFDKLLSYFADPQQQYKIASLLQLETETKARLRGTMFSLGLDLREDYEWREKALSLAGSFEGKSWNYFIKSLNEILHPFVARYKELADEAPADYAEIYQSMVIHEESLLAFSELELAGDTEHSLDSVIAQLRFPLPKPA
ncbi:MAG: hypothetical protein ACR2PS_09000 [Pseudomonadales bacterium]